ncbi:acyltransferase family protein [Streptomyces sp. NPDC048504]|uniref:acyltransferase family protein n=1 Tax=Streptomyces sp. NPDC048504 TaxID=3365559 RepID=UPI003717CFE0
MRGIAALLVFFFHISTSGLFRSAEMNHDVQFVFGPAGDLGVSFFFVLSGFVLTWSARPNDTNRMFWRRRFAKILPNHFVTWGLVLVLMLATGIAPSPFETVPNVHSADGFLPSVASFFLVQSWIPDVRYCVAGNPVSWSLACELMFYVCFPWLLSALSRIRPERLWYWALGTVAVIVAVPAVVGVVVPHGPALPRDPTVSAWHHFAISFFPPVRALEFVLGILMALIVLSGRWIPVGVLPATALLVAAYVIALYAPLEYALVAITVLPLALLVPAVATQDARGPRNSPGRRAMVWLGDVSFALYMVHISVIAYGHELIGGRGRTWSLPAGFAIMAAFCLVALFLAWLLCTAVEMPAMRRFGTTPRPAPALTSVPSGASGASAPQPEPNGETGAPPPSSVLPG